MATKKAASTARKTAAKKPVAKKPTNRTNVTTVKTVEPARVSAPARAESRGSVFSTLPTNLFGILMAEMIGTMILTLAALSPAVLTSTVGMAPIFVGFALVVIVSAIGNVSGAHVNPAVSFGLWSIGKLRALLLPFYWLAQFVGAMAAILTLAWISNGFSGLNFGHFWSFNWQIFGVEVLGTAVFVFGVAAILMRRELSNAGKALGIGLAFGIGILVSNTVLVGIQKNVDQSGFKAVSDVPKTLRVAGATLNPAVALGANEKTDTELQGGMTAKKDASYTRFGAEVIVATLLGGLVGANAARLVNYGRNDDDLVVIKK